jgi:DNA-binding NarL/FixJ family response regulator
MRVLLADDQPGVRFALRVLLERLPDLEVIGEAVNAAGLLAQAKEARPDLLLLDWPLPGAAPDDLLSALRRICPHLPVIALSGRPEMRGSALSAGADAFVCKGEPPEELLEAIVDCWYRQQGELPPLATRRASPETYLTPHL